MSKVSIFLCSLLLVFGNISFAKDAPSPLKDKKDAKITILSMSTFKSFSRENKDTRLGNMKYDEMVAVASAEHFFEKDDAKEEKKEDDDKGSFTVVNNAALGSFTKELSGVRSWKFASAAEDSNKEALETFRKNLEAALEVLYAGTIHETRVSPELWETAPGLPNVPVKAAVGVLTNGDYKKALAAAIVQYCKDAGVDGVWIQEVFLGYNLTGGSSLFGKFSGGSGQAVTKVGVAYGLYDSLGNRILDSWGETYESEGSFGMVLGRASFDKEKEKLLVETLDIAAKKSAKLLDKEL